MTATRSSVTLLLLTLVACGGDDGEPSSAAAAAGSAGSTSAGSAGTSAGGTSAGGTAGTSAGGTAGTSAAGAAGTSSAGAAGATAGGIACSCEQESSSSHGCVFYPEGMPGVAMICAALPGSCKAPDQTFHMAACPAGDTLLGCCERKTLDAAMNPTIGNCLYKTAKTTAAQVQAYIDSQCTGEGNTWKAGPAKI